MRISDWSSDVCSSDLHQLTVETGRRHRRAPDHVAEVVVSRYTRSIVLPGHSWPLIAALGNASVRRSRCRGDSLSAVSPCARCVPGTDRNSDASGKSVSVRLDIGGRRILKKKNTPY